MNFSGKRVFVNIIANIQEEREREENFGESPASQVDIVTNNLKTWFYLVGIFSKQKRSSLPPESSPADSQLSSSPQPFKKTKTI